MSKENKKDIERSLSDNIDNLLAGGELKTDATAEDINSELGFAHKMIALTPKPSPAFEARLKAKLLQKLSEEEIPEKGWPWRLVSQPVWQAVALSVFVIMAGFIIWQSGVLSPSEPIVTSNALKVEAKTNKATYAPGETVKVEVVLENLTSEPLTFAQFPPILSLMQTESRQPVFTFAAGSDNKTIMPGEEARFAVLWDQRDDSGRYVARGDYYIELEDISYRGRTLKLSFARPVTFDILPNARSVGEIYQTINLNQSQTVAGITVVIQKLELSNQGARLSAFVSPPPDYENRRTQDYTAFATYYIDRGWVKSAGLSSVEYHPTEMKHTWYLTEPIPQNTGEVLFVIMNIGEWEGPWQFRIPLQQ